MVTPAPPPSIPLPRSAQVREALVRLEDELLGPPAASIRAGRGGSGRVRLVIVARGLALPCGLGVGRWGGRWRRRRSLRSARWRRRWRGGWRRITRRRRAYSNRGIKVSHVTSLSLLTSLPHKPGGDQAGTTDDTSSPRVGEIILPETAPNGMPIAKSASIGLLHVRVPSDTDILVT